MRQRAKVDANQSMIVQALRAAGATVTPLHRVGKGCPDLLVGRDGKNFLLEVKTDLRGKLTPDEKNWHNEWRGKVAVVHDILSAYQAVEISKPI